MTKRFYTIVLLLFATILFGCSTGENDAHYIDSNIADSEEDQVVNSQTNVNGNDEEKTDVKHDELTVHYIDANQGDATLFQFEDYTILYDAGDWKDKSVINYLKQLNVDHIDLIIISHPHADHLGQLEHIINTISVDEVWMTENVANTKVFQQAINAILENDADFYEPTVGEQFDIGSMELTVLHPDDLTGGLNEDSLSVKFTYGHVSFIFTGDAYKNEELLMMKRDISLKANFLQLGHHGSNTSSHPTFVEAVNPDYAIYSAGHNNQYGHPHVEVVNYFHNNNINLLGTDVHGTIKVTTDGNKYNVSTEKEGKVTGKSDTTNENEKETDNPPEKSNPNSSCIDINTASKEELKQIIHIGDGRAEELISHRPYTSINELTTINGIGDSRLKDIKEQHVACVN